jgi:hypothetical protein
VPTAWKFHSNGQEAAIKLDPHFSTDENEGAIAAATAIDHLVASFEREPPAEPI